MTQPSPVPPSGGGPKRFGAFLGVFTPTVLTILGAIMYLVEGEASGFTSIPKSVYWAIVTLTTVGYGDISPETPAGQALAAVIMIMGYSIIAVPTGIVTAELTALPREQSVNTRECSSCGHAEVDVDAAYCRMCGLALT